MLNTDGSVLAPKKRLERHRPNKTIVATYLIHTASSDRRHISIVGFLQPLKPAIPVSREMFTSYVVFDICKQKCEVGFISR